MRHYALFFAIFFAFTTVSSGQEKFSNQFQPEFTALFKDSLGSVMPGLKLVFKKDIAQDVGLTDINGEIDLRLFPGDYEVTIENVDPTIFRAFLRIGGDNLPPGSPVFFIDTTQAFPETERPAIVKAVDPAYPPAAKAVRAYGEVKVTVKIDQDGRVTSAAATSGHPLLRAAAVGASRQFIFESSGKEPERTVDLSFAFLPIKKKDTNINRYQNSYRIIVHHDPQPVQFTSSQ